MNAEVVDVLTEIKWLLWAILAVTTVGTCLNLLWLTYVRRVANRRSKDDALETALQELYVKEDYEQLIIRCKEELSQNPREIYALWYLGKLHYDKGEYEQARQYFKKLAHYEPRWEAFVQPYLDKIHSEQY